MATITGQLETLKKCLEKQKECTSNSKTADTDSNKELLAQVKLDTKTALADLLRCLSSIEKGGLPTEDREKLDHQLHLLATNADSSQLLKWPLVRALEDPRCYRAFLGLPRVMEQTRRFLSTVKPTTLEEILKTCLPSDINSAQTTPTCTVEDPDLVVWVEQVLSYMTGDGRRKKELGGFVMVAQSKNALRAAINRAKTKRTQIQAIMKSHSTSASKDQSSTSAKAVFIDRDVRVVDQERQARQSLDLCKLVDKAADS